MRPIEIELAYAQSRAVSLFDAIRERGLITNGHTESEISEAIRELAAREFGVEAHWHKRLVRSGPNTRLPFRANPPDRMVERDDIVSIDLGPVFGAYEADFGRTFVLGDDPEKLRLRDDLARMFAHGRDFYLARPSMTGAELYEEIVRASAERGWGFGGAHAGHLVDAFPFAFEARAAAKNRIHPDNDVPMSAPDERGRARQWILEIHLLDPTGAFGGFFEELLVPVRAS